MSAPGLVEVIHWLEDVLDRLGLQRSYGGAIAYNYYGPPRLTQDVDILVLTRDAVMRRVRQPRHFGAPAGPMYSLAMTTLSKHTVLTGFFVHVSVT